MQVDLVEDRVRLRIIGVALGTLLYIAVVYQTIGLFAAERPRPTTIQFASTMPSATQFRDCGEVRGCTVWISTFVHCVVVT